MEYGPRGPLKKLSFCPRRTVRTPSTQKFDLAEVMQPRDGFRRFRSPTISHDQRRAPQPPFRVNNAHNADIPQSCAISNGQGYVTGVL